MLKSIPEFEIQFENHFPIIKIPEKNIIIKPVLRRDSQLDELLKESYKNSPNASKVLDDLDKDLNRTLVSIGFYKENKMVATLSAKLVKEQDFINSYLGHNEIIDNFVKIVLRTLQELDGIIIEVSRFASKSLEFRKYLYLFLAYYFYTINNSIIRNSQRFVLFSNCNSKHNKLYLRLFDSNERISTSQPTIVNGFEHNLNLYLLKEDSKIVSPYYKKLIKKINENLNKLDEAA